MKLLNHKIITIALLNLFILIPIVLGQRSGIASQAGSARIERNPEVKKRSQPISPTQTNTKEECNPDVETCLGTFYFSYGFGANARPRNGGNSVLNGGFSLTTYLNRQVFFGVGNDNFLSNKDTVNKRTTGFGDTRIFFGGDIFLDKTKTSILTLTYSLKAPTASKIKGIGSGKVDHTILGAFGKGFDKPRPTYIEFDVGNAFVGKTGGFDSFPFAVFLVRQKLDKKKKFTFHFEIDRTFKVSGYAGDAYNIDFLETQLSNSVALQTGGKFGITKNVSKAGLFLGLKYNGNWSKIFR